VSIQYVMRIADIPGGPSTQYYSDVVLVSEDPYVVIDPASELEQYRTPNTQ